LASGLKRPHTETGKREGLRKKMTPFETVSEDRREQHRSDGEREYGVQEKNEEMPPLLIRGGGEKNSRPEKKKLLVRERGGQGVREGKKKRTDVQRSRIDWVRGHNGGGEIFDRTS